MSLSFHSGKPFLSNESSMLFRIPAASALYLFFNAKILVNRNSTLSISNINKFILSN
jgi:hypothetical protein